MTTPSGSAWIAECRIGEVKLDVLVEKFEWKSLVNGGYIIRAKIIDPYFQILNEVIEENGNNFLPTGRQYDGPTICAFKLKWDNGIESKERVALVSDMHALGNSGYAGAFEFVAIDPISYYINAGDTSGKVFKGKIGGDKGIIKQVLEEYVPSNIGGYDVKYDIGETDDQDSQYWMMRQDPKTFIASMLDWSSSFTKHKTSWIVASGQEESTLSIQIKESWTPDLKYPSKVEGSSDSMIMGYGGSSDDPVTDILKWELLTDNFISALNLKLVTAGVSAMSGEYLDRIVDEKEEIVFVKDSNTENKLNVKIGEKEGFTKPKKEDKGWTQITSIPEIYSAGDIGHKYSRYIDGRARQKYMEMLNMVMRARITVRGQPRLFDSTELGRTKITLRWLKPNADGSTEPRFLDGDWILYGWHHILYTGGKWETDLYIARLDYDADALTGD